MQSEAEWDLRNAALSRALCGLASAYAPREATRGLDVGAQDGALMDRYADLTGLDWIGIDPIFSEEQESPQGRLLVPGVADRIPFAAHSFDVVILANVFEHLQPKRRVESLGEIKRVLRGGGVVVGQIPNPYFVIENHSRLPLLGWLPVRLQKRYWQLSRVPWELDFFVVTPRHLRAAVVAAGLEVLLIRRFNYPLEVIPARVRPLARLIDRPTRRLMPWAWQFVLGAGR